MFCSLSIELPKKKKTQNPSDSTNSEPTSTLDDPSTSQEEEIQEQLASTETTHDQNCEQEECTLRRSSRHRGKTKNTDLPRTWESLSDNS